MKKITIIPIISFDHYYNEQVNYEYYDEQDHVVDEYTHYEINYNNWEFSTIQHWGESIAGTWELLVYDEFEGDYPVDYEFTYE